MSSQEKFPVIMCNGQKIYQVSSKDPHPPRGCEVFVGNLPRDLYEDDLIPLLSKAGKIFKFRLMMDFCGQTRGFGFVTYYTPEDAANAVQIFDKRLVESRSRTAYMSVRISLDNCRLYLGNIPRYKRERELLQDLSETVEGVVQVITFPDRRDPRRNRGFAFVEFESHALASIARRKLLYGVGNPWGKRDEDYCRVYVDWAEPEPIVDPMVLTQVKILYFKNVPTFWSIEDFRTFLLTILKEKTMVKIYKKDNYGFVHFKDRQSAEMALEAVESAHNLTTFIYKKIEVEWARPCNYSKKYTGCKRPDNLCISVPARLRKQILINKKNFKGPHPGSDEATSDYFGSDGEVESSSKHSG